jgi:hypothetical protein
MTIKKRRQIKIPLIVFFRNSVTKKKDEQSEISKFAKSYET